MSFYITEDALDLKPLLYQDDLYFIYWLATLIPIFDPENLTDKLWQQNSWLKNFLPNVEPRETASQREISPLAISKALEKVFGFHQFENLAEKLEKSWMPESLKKIANQDSRVVLNEKILKFHDNDRRKEYAQAFHERLNHLGANL